jgi:hypothetical protein
MTWAQKSAQSAERDAQRKAEEAREVARRQAEREAETAALADRLSPLVTRLLDEAGEALFGHGGLFNRRRYTVTRDGSEWRLEPKQALRVLEWFAISIFESTHKTRWTRMCIRVLLVPDLDSESESRFHIRAYRLTQLAIPADHSPRRGEWEEDPSFYKFLLPEYSTPGLSEAALVEGLQRFVYHIKTAMHEWADQ